MALATITARGRRKRQGQLWHLLLQCWPEYFYRNQSVRESSFTRKPHPVWNRPDSRPIFLRGKHGLCKEIRPGAESRERRRPWTGRSGRWVKKYGQTMPGNRETRTPLRRSAEAIMEINNPGQSLPISETWIYHAIRTHSIYLSPRPYRETYAAVQ